MKPRNEYENRLAAINATLTEDIAAANAEWAKKASSKWDMHTYCYFTIHATIRGFKVKRLYRAYKFTDRSTSHFFFVEILRQFTDGDHTLYFAKQRTMGHYYDTFAYNSPIELRSVHKNTCGYDLSKLLYLSVASHREQRGQRIPCQRINPNELARVIRNNPVAENLYKHHDPLFRHLVYQGRYAKQFCRAITLAKRHGFTFTDENATLWFDMVSAIIYLGKDHHNPVYIAPEDLHATHDRFVTMMYRKQRKDREQRERRMEQLRQQREYERIQNELKKNKTINEQYIRRRHRFYDMLLTDGLIQVSVLRDVEAFRQESCEMHHCVYTNRYFEKPYSLILSARIGEQRIETIEVSLTDYTITQSYGKHNQFTMHHDRILSLVNSQMDTIRQYNRKRATNKTKKAV